MNKFNLSFRGEVIPGKDPGQVKIGLGELLGIHDSQLLLKCFSGKAVILRRNLDRKTAAELYSKLYQLGAVTKLVKVTESDVAGGTEKVSPSRPTEAVREPAPPSAPSMHSVVEKIQKQGGNREKTPTATRTAPRNHASERGSNRVTPQYQSTNAPVVLSALEESPARATRAQRRAQIQLERERERARKSVLAAKAEEELAQRNTELAEIKRKQAEQALQRKARMAEEKRRQTELVARHKIELKRQKAEEAARRKAELAEQKRRQAEQVAQFKAEQARRKAEEAARREADKAERKRRETESKRREAEHQARLEAERAEQARVQREQEEKQKRLGEAEAAALAAKREKQKREAAELAARAKAENEERKRQQAEEQARLKAEEQRKKAERRWKMNTAAADQDAERLAMEEQAIQRAASELAQKPSLKSTSSPITTIRSQPVHKHEPVGNRPDPVAVRKRQAGAANLYNLRPFRNTAEVQARAEISSRRVTAYFRAAILALAGLLILGSLALSRSPPARLTGASAMGIDPLGKPLLMAGDQLLLHDRAGNDTGDLKLSSLGLARLGAPLLFNAEGQLFALGELIENRDQAENPNSPQLLRCDIAEARCEVFSEELARSNISTMVINPLDGTLLVADAEASQLLKVSARGEVLARAAAAIPDDPVLRLDAGLLMMNSALGSAISVFRYDAAAFGRQLDEILLVLPAGRAAEYSMVADFVRAADNWWVMLYEPESGRAGLYRFNSQWNFIDRVELARGTRPQQLAIWGGTILVTDSQQVPIQRFSAEGIAGVPLISGQLAELVTRQKFRAHISTLVWRLSLVLCALVTLAGWSIGSLHVVRSMVYKTCRERGAEPVDERAGAITWVDPATDRTEQLRRTVIGYALVSAAAVLVAVILAISALQLSALLLALTGPAVAVMFLRNSHPGHIGITHGKLLLVDHNGIYHLGGTSRIQYRGYFVMLDDVVVFTGTRLLPAFSSTQILNDVMPLATTGIKVDRRIVLVKLIQSRHPLAIGVVATAISLSVAATLLSLQGIF